MVACVVCGGSIDSRSRFCLWCGSPQRWKMVDLFRAAPLDAGKALRVSRYLHDRHVRFSVWNDDGTVEATVSLTEEEAERLSKFLVEAAPRPRLRDTLPS
jgi:hypothetical protein